MQPLPWGVGGEPGPPPGKLGQEIAGLDAGAVAGRWSSRRQLAVLVHGAHGSHCFLRPRAPVPITSWSSQASATLKAFSNG
jgi:hypothetical protein